MRLAERKTTQKYGHHLLKKGGRVVPYDPDRNRDTDCCEYYQGNLTRKRSRPIELQPFTDCHHFAIVMVVHALRKSRIVIKLYPANRFRVLTKVYSNTYASVIDVQMGFTWALFMPSDVYDPLRILLGK